MNVTDRHQIWNRRRRTGDGGQGTSTENEKMRNGNKIKQRIGNEVTGRVRVQVSFCIQVFIFLVPRARSPHSAPRIPRGEGKVKEKLVSFLSSKEMSSGVFRAFVKIRTESSKLAVRNTE